jgi:SAM-dependent methyltransferase
VYDETFGRLCAGTYDALLAALDVAPGDAVLDVGAGTGLLAERLLEAGAEVSLAEPDPLMLGRAGVRLPQVSLHRDGLPHLPFDDGSFDAVCANFVVNHLDDPRAGTAELVRVTAPGGRVAVTIWPSGRNAQSRLWDAVVEASGAVRPAGVRLPAERDFPRTEDGLAGLLAGAGLVDVVSTAIGWTHRGDIDDLWRGAEAGIGGIGVVVTAQREEVRERMRTAYDRLVRDLLGATDDGLAFETEALLAVGTRPSQAAR